MRQLSISAGPAATLLVAGDPDNPLPTLIQNVDPVNIVYLGESVGINPAQPNTCAPLNPGQTSVASGDINVFGIAASGTTVQVNVYRGLMSFFQPISQLVIAGPSAGIFIYSPSAGLGNLVGSWASQPGVDQYGNVYNAGMTLTSTPSTVNIFTVQDTSGNTLFSIDSSGNLVAGNVSADTITLDGQDLSTLLLSDAQGLVTRGWVVAAANWPATALTTAETAILELDWTVPANRQHELRLLPIPIIPTISANTQHIHRLKYTTDGSTPTTGSPQFANHSPGVTALVSGYSGLNVPVIGMQCFLPINSVDTLYRVLLTGTIQAGTYQYSASNMPLEMDVFDWGTANLPNQGVSLGSGTSGSAGRQTYTKTYTATATHSYYGATGTYGSGHYGKRSDNASLWQSCASSNAFLEGDQYSFAVFNQTQINSDLAGATLNWAKLTLTNQTAGVTPGHVICGFTTYTGVFGDPFVPGGGTHFNQEEWNINRGATLTHTLGPWFGTVAGSSFAAFTFGPASSADGYTDQANYCSFFGYSVSDPRIPTLQLNYTK